MNGHPHLRVGQNPAYRPSGAVRVKAVLSYILCLLRAWILLISKYGYFPRIDKGERGIAVRSSPVLTRRERNENTNSPALPRVSVEDYMVWPKSVATEHLGFAFFY
jgi:hypothetical protein